MEGSLLDFSIKQINSRRKVLTLRISKFIFRTLYAEISNFSGPSKTHYLKVARTIIFAFVS
jgi:hypothetical protein